MLTPELLHTLRSVDTPTNRNPLERAVGGRTAEDFMYGTPVTAVRSGKREVDDIH